MRKVWTLFFFCFLLPPLWGKEEFPIPFTVRAFEKQFDLEKKKLVLKGCGRVSTPYFVLQGDRLTLWWKEEKKEPSLLRWEARGEVFFYSPPISMEAEKFWYDQRIEYGEATKVRLYLYPVEKPYLQSFEEKLLGKKRKKKKSREFLTPLYVNAEKLELRCLFSPQFEIVAHQVTISTCTFFTPHYAFQAKRITLKNLASDRQIVVLRDFTWQVQQTALFYLPYFYWDTLWNPIVPTVKWGSTSRFGLFGLFRWRLPETPLGRGQVAVDFYKKRGTAFGARWDVKRPFQLRTEGYTIYDQAEGKKDRNGFVFPKRQRYWVRSFLSYTRERHFMLLGEFQRFSDRGVMEEYRERSWKQDKPPESYVYAQYLFPRSGARLEVKVRQNDFFQEVEKLPDFRWEGISLPLGSLPIYVDWSLLAGYYRFFQKGKWTPEYALFRSDQWVRVSLPFVFLYSSWEPYWQFRFSWFEKVIQGDNHRFRSKVGAIWRFRLFRNFSFGKHILLWQARYENIFWNTKSPEELYFFDEVEKGQKGEKLLLTFRSYWQRKKKHSPQGEVHLYANYYPRKLYNREIEEKSWGFLQADGRISQSLIWIPVSLGVSGGLGYHPYRGRLYRGYAGLSLKWPRWWKISISFLYRRRIQKQVSLSGQILWNPKWAMGGYFHFDLEKKQIIQQGFTIRRKLHHWDLVIRVELDRSLEDFRISVNLLPPFFGAKKAPFASELGYGIEPLPMPEL